MAYKGIYQGGKETCGICKKTLSKGDEVYHDPTKTQGNHLVHVPCLDKLRAGRKKQPPPGKKKLSTEPLDPPF